MYNPLLLVDFYKVCHSSQYPKGLTKMVSYYTPRMSRLSDTDKITMFGLQAFIKEYLIEGFNTNFFNRSEDVVVGEYERVLNATLGKGTYDSQKIRDLHRLGYLPLEISAVPEGTRTGIGVPQIEITNTHPNFVWLVNTIETMLSCTMWHTQVSAEVGYRYWQIIKKYWEKTCDESVDPRRLLGDFSMRGQHSVESAIKSSAGWCLSFLNTATVPAILWLEDNYNCDCVTEDVGYGAISTEHSVMCSNFAIDGDEITHVRRLLTEIYPHNNFSMVSDSYDYWNLVDSILPQLKDEILAHDGCISIRGDSGDPVEVIAGLPFVEIPESEWEFFDGDEEEWVEEFLFDNNIDINEYNLILKHGDEYIRVKAIADWANERGGYTGDKYYFIDGWDINVERNIIPTSEEMGTVWALWQTFGGKINSKGYKVLNPHVKAIYGDSITPDRCKEIYERLTDKGFAINNVTLGVGSFSMMCLETLDSDDEKHYNPYTRDTFGIAVKATYAEDKDGRPLAIYKQPKALSWKKSQKGCCILSQDGQSYTDNHNFGDTRVFPNLITPVFRNGVMTREYTLSEVRNNMYPEGF